MVALDIDVEIELITAMIAIKIQRFHMPILLAAAERESNARVFWVLIQLAPALSHTAALARCSYAQKLIRNRLKGNYIADSPARGAGEGIKPGALAPGSRSHKGPARGAGDSFNGTIRMFNFVSQLYDCPLNGFPS